MMHAMRQRAAGLAAFVALATACAHHEPAPEPPPAADRRWMPSAAVVAAPAPAPAPPPALQAGRAYRLPELIDVAMRTNPDTRLSWERARAAAARLDRAESEYLPILALNAQAGYSRVEDRTTEGGVFTAGPSFTPRAVLAWRLLDWGRRDAEWDARAQELLAADFEFNRRHQEIAYSVERAFFRFDATRAEIVAMEATLDAARQAREASDALARQGLATRTDAAVARQQEAQARYELEVARKLQADARADLARALGISPATPLELAEVPDGPELPSELDASVDDLIAAALQGRPDLASLASVVRGRAEEVRRAEADFRPTLSADGAVGGAIGTFRAEGRTNHFDYSEPIWGAFFVFNWEVFDGGRRQAAVREAQAKFEESEADLAILRLQAEGDVWRSWADYQAARTQVESARVLLDASQEAYDAVLAGYRAGLSSVTELVQVERDLARARSTRIDSRARMLDSAASLMFAVGAPVPAAAPTPPPR
jgi:outer membrane protein